MEVRQFFFYFSVTHWTAFLLIGWRWSFLVCSLLQGKLQTGSKSKWQLLTTVFICKLQWEAGFKILGMPDYAYIQMTGGNYRTTPGFVLQEIFGMRRCSLCWLSPPPTTKSPGDAFELCSSDLLCLWQNRRPELWNLHHSRPRCLVHSLKATVDKAADTTPACGTEPALVGRLQWVQTGHYCLILNTHWSGSPPLCKAALWAHHCPCSSLKNFNANPNLEIFSHCRFANNCYKLFPFYRTAAYTQSYLIETQIEVEIFQSWFVAICIG